MVLFNYSTKELTAKVVYYGPGLCGKTTNLQYIHGNLPANVKGKMLSLATKTDRTLFFDFLPIDLGHIRGMKTRVQLYTVPGQVFYNETRKLVLKGADGIVFVADSQKQMIGANVESFKNLEENLKAHGLTLAEMPHVLQFNKRDLPKLASIEELNAAINRYNAPFYESVATTGIGVQDTLKAITKLVLVHLTQKYDPKARPAAAETAATVPPAVAPAVSGRPVVEPDPSQTQRIPVAAVVPSHGETQAIPLSADPAPLGEAAEVADVGRQGPAGPVEPLDLPPAPRFDEGEIEDLVDEVEEVSPEAAPAETAGPPSFEIDDSAIQLEEEPTEVLGAAEESALLPEEEPHFEFDRRADSEWSAEERDQAAAPVDAVAQAAETAAMAAADRFENGAAEARIEAPPEEETLAVEEPAPEIREETAAAPEPVAEEAEGLEASPVEPEPQEDVALTELATDQDLFEDPSLEVAQVTSGVERSIVIPVELGDADREKRRFKLTIQLRLDPVD